MEKKILYHIGLYGFRKLIVYERITGIVRLSLVLMETVHSLSTFGTVIYIT